MQINRTIVTKILLLTALFIISFFPVARAATVISGDIANGTVWNKEGSPYLISEMVVIPAGVELSIEPGTIIKSGNGTAGFEVFGSIKAIGTNTEPITFTSWNDDSFGGDTNDNEVDPAFSDWNGMNFNPDSTATFDHINFLYSYINTFESPMTIDNARFQFAELSVSGPGDVTVRNSLFEDAHGAGIEVRSDINVFIDHTTIDRANRNALLISGGTVGVTDSNILNTKPGQLGNAIQLIGNSTLMLNKSVLDGGTVGIKSMGPNTFKVADSIIRNFTNTGISDGIGPVLAIAQPMSHVATLASTPYDGANVDVTRSEITGNGTGIIVRDESTVSINQNSIHGNQIGADGIPFKNNWWGDASGPHDAIRNPTGTGDEVPEYMEYTPWLVDDPLQTSVITCCSSVAFFPGMEGSRLYSESSGKLWEPTISSDVSNLNLDAKGISIDKTIYTKDVIEQFKVFGINSLPLYKSFIQVMNGFTRDGVINSWKALPYDWRMSVTDIVNNGVKTETGTVDLVQEIETLAKESKTGKVTLVAHSDGGLVAKALVIKLQELGIEGLVDKVLLVSVPQLGTPDAVSALLHGVNLPENIVPGIIMSKTSSRTLAENMPGGYGLLPTNKYFEETEDPVVEFDQSVNSIGKFISQYGMSIDTETELSDFLLGKEGREKPSKDNVNPPNVLNSLLLLNAKAIHEQLDGWVPPEDIKVIQIAGWGSDTVKGIKYKAKYPCSKLITIGVCAPYIDATPIYTLEGDKTVVYPSAVALNGEKLYFNIDDYNDEVDKNYSHKDIFEAEPVLNVIKKKIIEEDSSEQYIDEIKPKIDQKSSIRVSMHSPATIDLYDDKGNHTGLVNSQQNAKTAQYEENIPNSYYREFGEGKYIGVIGDITNTVKIQGTGSGTFTLNIEYLTGDTNIKTDYFSDIPVTPDTKAQVSLGGNTPELLLDNNGDGRTDFEIQPSQSEDEGIDPLLFLQILKQSIHSLGLSAKIEQPLQQKIDKLLKAIAKGNKKKTISLIKQYGKMVESQKWGKIKKLNAEQKIILVEMIGKLLDTIQ